MIDPMIIKEITAHHEAAHAVLTHISKFHSLIGAIRLASEDIGDTFFSLSKKKLAREHQSGTGSHFYSDSSDKNRHGKMVKLVEQTLSLHKQLAGAKTPDEKTRIQRQIDATDQQIGRLVYELYGLTEKEIPIVEKETQSG